MYTTNSALSLNNGASRHVPVVNLSLPRRTGTSGSEPSTAKPAVQPILLLHSPLALRHPALTSVSIASYGALDKISYLSHKLRALCLSRASLAAWHTTMYVYVVGGGQQTKAGESRRPAWPTACHPTGCFLNAF